MVISALVKKLIGSRNTRMIKRLQKYVVKINQLEKTFQTQTDNELQAKTVEFKSRLQHGEALDSLLPEAFALVREASVRVLGMRHFDTQLIGGMVLHQGKIAEMRTGEGKTLAATLPAYLNALTGKGVYIVTVNDYLAKRDAAWMNPVYQFLGLTTGVIVPGLNHKERQAAYACDVTFGTNNEFGFDYLRDNMAFSINDKVQRELHFAIIDEVDSILIDEARTPLIISGMAEDSSAIYLAVNLIVPKLTKVKEKEGPGDYYVDEKIRQVFLTEDGHQHIEKLLQELHFLKNEKSLYDVSNISLMHHINAALRAHAVYQKDIDYIIEDGTVVIIDEHTGRKMVGRRWSDGLHQAIEAKENVKIQNESQTLASITFQNYFRLFSKLSGMTGTADTEAYEFQQIYGLEVVVVPTNKLMIRNDQPDLVYLNLHDKFQAIIEDIKSTVIKGQPVLVGTASIETSELLSGLLSKEKVKHQVLNAKFHEKEANIIAEAGRPGAVTIATNMAGRGTDIVLGGNWKSEIKALENPTEEQHKEIEREWQKRNEDVIKAGGLRIIGSERHESRRIDNQLRGRSGRQGDPGSSRFYLSLEDNLLRIFASERLSALMQRVGMQAGDSLESSLLTRSIEGAQRKVEGHNFDMRKQLLEFDDVANVQRKVIYQQRSELMKLENISDEITNIRDQVAETVVRTHVPVQSMIEQWDLENLAKELASSFNVSLDFQGMLAASNTLSDNDIVIAVKQKFIDFYLEKTAKLTDTIMRPFEKSVMLQLLDNHWREHLSAMEHLRQGIHLRGYAQKNPKQEYKREAFELFTQMLNSIKYEVISGLMSFEIKAEEDLKALENQRRKALDEQALQMQHSQITIMDTISAPLGKKQEENKTFVRGAPKTGRNDLCPCNSGKKYKACHGQLS